MSVKIFTWLNANGKEKNCRCTRCDQYWVQTSAAKWMRTAIFRVITQPLVVISYRRFGTTYRSHLQGSLTSMGISLQTQSRSAGRDIPQILQNQKGHYPLNKAPLLPYILSHLNSRTHTEPLHDVSFNILRFSVTSRAFLSLDSPTNILYVFCSSPMHANSRNMFADSVPT
jgi:hypothetical protein